MEECAKPMPGPLPLRLPTPNDDASSYASSALASTTTAAFSTRTPGPPRGPPPIVTAVTARSGGSSMARADDLDFAHIAASPQLSPHSSPLRCSRFSSDGVAEAA